MFNFSLGKVIERQTVFFESSAKLNIFIVKEESLVKNSNGIYSRTGYEHGSHNGNIYFGGFVGRQVFAKAVLAIKEVVTDGIDNGGEAKNGRLGASIKSK